MSDDNDDGEEEGKRRRDAGMKQAEEAQGRRDEEALVRAFETIRWVAERNEYFTADDVRASCPVKLDRPKAWGPVYKKAHKLGIMEVAVGIPYVKSKRPSAHAAAIPVYRSLICEGVLEPAE